MPATSPDKQIAELLAAMSAGGVHFFPIRHHSPACSWHLTRLIRQVRPASVLIEGPADLTPLVPVILNEQTRPPLAAFTTYVDKAHRLDIKQEGPADQPARFAAYYPLCNYSPELVALRVGREVGARLRFIDLTYPEQVLARKKTLTRSSSVQMVSLLEENYLKSSEYVRRLADATGCRDADELWDHLFEVECTRIDTDQFVRNVAAYCLLARAHHDPQILRVDGTVARERAMARAILEEMAGYPDAPVVVVTGGFHTAELPHMVLAKHGNLDSESRSPSFTSEEASTCLMAYSFDQLDGLNGYAAGMPLPGYYERVWGLLAEGHDDPLLEAAGRMIVEVGQFVRDKQMSITISAADEIAALTQARRLAQVRGHAGPAREDLLDAMRSCFVPGAMDAEGMVVMQVVRQILCGWAGGCVGPGAGVPPLVQDFRRLADRLGLKISDTLPRQVVLDVYRKASHRRISRFLNQLSYLNVPFATLLRGPDFSAGIDTELIQEHWQYGWSPATEGRLIEVSVYGPSVEQASLARLQEAIAGLQEQGRGRSTVEAVSLLALACQMGLQNAVLQIAGLLKAEIAEDGSFPSLVKGLGQLLLLWQSRQTLEAGDPEVVVELARAAYSRACFLLSDLANVTDEQVDEVLAGIAWLREIVIGSQAESLDGELLFRALRDVVEAPRSQPAILGGAVGSLFGQGRMDEDELLRRMAGTIDGATFRGQSKVTFVRGLLATCREAVWRVPVVLARLSELMSNWSEDEFLASLPDLRLSFADLTPREIDRVAQQVASLQGKVDLGDLVHVDITEADILFHLSINQAAAAALTEQGLAGWAGCHEEKPAP